MQYRVTKADNSTVTIEADYFEQDGSGLRLYKEVVTQQPAPTPEDPKATVSVTTNRMVASYRDGSFRGCEPADAVQEPAPVPTSLPNTANQE